MKIKDSGEIATRMEKVFIAKFNIRNLDERYMDIKND